MGKEDFIKKKESHIRLNQNIFSDLNKRCKNTESEFSKKKIREISRLNFTIELFESLCYLI